MLKKTLALFLTLLLCVSGSVMAFAASDRANTITGEVDIINPVFRVALPLNLNFALDPLKLNGQSQIYSGATSYNVVNKTAAPIKVDFALNITATSGVVFTNDPGSDIETDLPDNSTVVAKDIYLAVQGAQSISATSTYDAAGKLLTTTGISATTLANNVVANYATGGVTKDVDAVEFDITTEMGSARGIFSFLIDAGELDDTSEATKTDISKNKPTETSIASFRLYSEMNTYADWESSDLSFEGSYDFRAIAKEDYDEEVVDKNLLVSGVPALMKTAGTYVPLATPATYAQSGFIIDGDTVSTPQTKALKSGVELVVPFYAATAIESVTLGGSATTAYSTGANSLVFKFTSTGPKVMVVKLKDDDTQYKITITVS